MGPSHEMDTPVPHAHLRYDMAATYRMQEGSGLTQEQLRARTLLAYLEPSGDPRYVPYRVRSCACIPTPAAANDVCVWHAVSCLMRKILCLAIGSSASYVHRVTIKLFWSQPHSVTYLLCIMNGWSFRRPTGQSA